MPFVSGTNVLGNRRDVFLLAIIFVFACGLFFMMQGGFGVWWQDGLLNLGSAAVSGLLWADLRRSGAQALAGVFAWMALLTLSIALLIFITALA